MNWRCRPYRRDFRSPRKTSRHPQAEQDLIAANAQIGVAKAQYFPGITSPACSAGKATVVEPFHRTGPDVELGRSFAHRSSRAAPTGQVKAAEAFGSRLLRYEKSIQNAFRDVDDALVDQKRMREQLEAQRRQVEALRTYARVSRLRYDNGYTSYIEVLDAERSLFDAELGYTQTKGTLFRR